MNEGKNKKTNLILYGVILVIVMVLSYSAGYFINKNTLDKKETETNNQLESKSNSNIESNTQSDVNSNVETKSSNSNVAVNSNNNSTNSNQNTPVSYTAKDITGTFKAKSGLTLSLSSKGIFRQMLVSIGCGDYDGNYLLDGNTLILYPVLSASCDMEESGIIKDEVIKVNIVSKNELIVDGEKYTRADSKDFDDSYGGLRYMFKTYIEEYKNKTNC